MGGCAGHSAASNQAAQIRDAILGRLLLYEHVLEIAHIRLKLRPLVASKTAHLQHPVVAPAGGQLFITRLQYGT